MEKLKKYSLILLILFWPALCQAQLYEWGATPEYIMDHKTDVMVGETQLYEITFLELFPAYEEFMFQDNSLQAVTVFPMGRQGENPSNIYHNEFTQINSHFKGLYGNPAQPDPDTRAYEWMLEDTRIYSSFGGSRWVVDFYPRGE